VTCAAAVSGLDTAQRIAAMHFSVDCGVIKTSI
jgi:hypothetical protein